VGGVEESANETMVQRINDTASEQSMLRRLNTNFSDVSGISKEPKIQLNPA